MINGDNNALIRSEKSRLSLRVNSIYSQERWYAKGASIFCTDVKQHGTFQVGVLKFLFKIVIVIR